MKVLFEGNIPKEFGPQIAECESCRTVVEFGFGEGEYSRECGGCLKVVCPICGCEIKAKIEKGKGK